MNTLLVLGLQVTLVALAGIVVSLATRKWMSTSGTLPLRATLGAVVLLTACAFSSWPSWLHRSSDEGRRWTPVSDLARPRRYAPESAPLAPSLTLNGWSVPTWVVSWVEGSASDKVSNALPAIVESDRPASWSWQHWLLLTVGGAMLIGLIRVIGGLWAVRLFVRTSRPLKSQSLLEQVDLLRAEMSCTQPVEVRECPQMATAATVGWRRPVVLLSDSWQSWTPDQLRSVLAHEIAHITRGDFLATVAAQVGVVLHFYHPLVHWLANRLRLEQELAADALAAKVVGGSRAYLNAIGELALKQSSEPVGWPAHSFLPTRRTFLRRIEMLRDLKFLSGGNSRLVKWATLASVAAVTLLAIGLRPPVGELSSPQAEAQAPQPSPTAQLSGGLGGSAVAAGAPLEARYVPAEAAAVLVARPDLIAAQLDKLKADKLIPAETENPYQQIAGCVSASVAFVLPDLNQPSHVEPVAYCLTFTSKDARDQAAQKMGPPASFSVPGQTEATGWKKTKFLLFEMEVHSLTNDARYFPDDLSIVAGSKSIVERVLMNGPKSTSPLTETAAWKTASQGALAVAVDSTSIQKLMAQAPPNPITGMFAPLWNSTVRHTLGLSIHDNVGLTLTSESRDAAGTQQVEATEKAAMAFLSNILGGAQNSSDPMAKQIAAAFLPIVNAHKIASNGNLTTLQLQVDQAALLSAVALPVMRARESAQRAQQQNNMKQIMLALHNYHDVYGHLPPAIVIDKNSGIPRSWRVEILPFIEGAALYDQYKKDQPWDSEENKKILAQMPFVFRHPSQPAGATITSIFAAYGDGFAFQKDDKIGLKFQDIADGTSTTIAIIEANAEIPWTKPEELSIDLSQGAPKNFGFAPTAFGVGLCDGSVHMITRTIEPQLLKVMFTRNGGEVVNEFDRPKPTVPVPAPAVPATPR